MNDLILQAEEALYRKDGQTALQITDRLLEQDEGNSKAWFIAMQCFQFIYPIDQYNAENELSCARFAIRSASKEQKYQMKKQVYSFLLEKILAVLKRDAEVLADCRDVLGFYQRTVYFDASGAAEKTRAYDEPVQNAVEKSFSYCEQLFDFIPDSAIRGSRKLNQIAEEIACQWKTTCNYLVMRLGLFHFQLTPEQMNATQMTYTRYLRAVKNKEEMLQKPLFSRDTLSNEN